MTKVTKQPLRLLRWVVVNLIVGLGLFALAGTWRDPWLWAYLAVVAAAGLYPTLRLDDDLARERFSPPERGADWLALRVVRLLGLSHLIVGALDGGRWHLTHVPDPLRLAGLVGLVASVTLVFRAMMDNHFFSPTVRIQQERGHHVVDQGMYALIRHPGYAGMIPSMACSGLALGSWLAFALGVAYGVMMLRRVLFEEAYLRVNLGGYTEYASRVRYRLIPRVW